MPQLLRSRTVTARKPHRCMTCNATAIRRGEQYQRDTYAYDGQVYDWVQCADCAAIGGIVFEWAGHPDEGVGADDYMEWAREAANEDTPEGEQARRYLARVAGESDVPERWTWTCEDCDASGVLSDDILTPMHDCRSRGPFDEVSRLVIERAEAVSL